MSMNHIRKSKNLMKSESIWHKLDKETKYDLLELTDKEKEAIALSRQKRLERKAKNRKSNETKGGE